MENQTIYINNATASAVRCEDCTLYPGCPHRTAYVLDCIWYVEKEEEVAEIS